MGRPRIITTSNLTAPRSPEEANAVIGAWARSGYSTKQFAKDHDLAYPTAAMWVREANVVLGTSKGQLAPVAPIHGLNMTKTTVQYNAAGDVIQEWRRLAPEAEALEAIADNLCKIVKGKSPKLPPAPKIKTEDLMLELPLFDVHFGKYCDAHETDTNYDIKIAKKIVVGAVDRVCQTAGPVGETLIVIGGDFFHSDTRHNRTEMSGHPLDVDTRQHKVWEYATNAIHESVLTAAKYSAKVRLLVIPGNHDWESSYHLSRVLAAYYRNEARVSVVDSPKSRRYVRWGVVLLGFAHGNLMKMGDMATLMAHDQGKIWGETKFRVWHMGHIHKAKGLKHLSFDGVHGVEVEHLESIAGTDAWHHENGFVGMPRRLTGFVWDRKQGLRQRIYVNASEIEENG